MDNLRSDKGAVSIGSREEPPDRSTIIQDPAEMRRMLRMCCEHGRSARIFFPGVATSLEAKFDELTDRRIILCPEASVDVESLPVLALCSLFFQVRSHSCVGMTWLREFEVTGRLNGSDRIALTIPKYIVSLEARNAFRVPILSGSGLQVTVQHADRTYRPKPVNISFGGLMVDFSDSTDPHIPLGTVVQVHLCLNQSNLKLPAIVRWTEAGGYGLFFNTQVEGGEIAACDELSQMVRKLGRPWFELGAA